MTSFKKNMFVAAPFFCVMIVVWLLLLLCFFIDVIDLYFIAVCFIFYC